MLPSFKKINLSDFFKSTKYFFSKDYLSDGTTFLDVGGSSGTFANADQSEYRIFIPEMNIIIDDEIFDIRAN